MSQSNNLQVLVVDDDAGFRDVLCGFLESRNLIVRQASSGMSALDEINRATPDIIFLDVYMPEMNGLQVLKTIREHWPQVKVIVMSGYATEEMAKEAMDLGATDFLNKPIELELLDDMLPLFKSDVSEYTTN
ncbi:hypothetical protein AMJ86_03665 [bacterium SM23_57]|nr:MAG: hypothetical protein AMJ86_03665 [bacterium SM23_57]